MRQKQVVCTLVSIHLDSLPLGNTIKVKCTKLKTTDPEILLNFNISVNGLGLVSPQHFVHGFSIKMFFMLHSMS